MSVLHLAAKFGQLKVIDMLWGKTPIEQVSVKVRIRDEYICKRLLFTEVVLKSNKNRRKAIFNWAAKGLFFLRGGGGYTYSKRMGTTGENLNLDTVLWFKRVKRPSRLVLPRNALRTSPTKKKESYSTD